MKKMLRAIAYAMALNFLLVVGGGTYLWKSGNLDKDRLNAIKEIIFPTTQPVTLTTSQQPGATTQPSIQLDELIRKAAGLPADQQVDFLQRSFDARMSELDLRERGLQNQQVLIERARQDLTQQRLALDADKKKLTDDQQAAAAQAADQGFQDSLALYQAMPAKQVKTIFMALPDETVKRYLEAMDPMQAGKILKEFKTQDETDRIQKVLELIRQPKPDSTASATTPTATPSASAQ